jgi:ABC-2 type transport system ATP-binding protein
LIRIERASKHFGDLVAVDDLSLEISEGEIFGLLGPNGAGKSTIISMISGQQLPTSGSLRVSGKPPTSRAAKRLIGVAPQAIALYEDLSALDNLEFFGALYGLKRGELRARTKSVLDFVGLTDRAKDRVEKYSGGMKRRLNLAATLMHQPDILLLDEPTVGVDPQSRNKLFENVLDLKARGKTIVYTTHYMEEAERLCDRVGILDQGRLLALGDVDTLIDAHGGDSSLSISTDDGEIVRKSSQPIADLQALLREYPDVRDLRLARPDLEQVFLNLTGRHLRD